MHVIPPYSTKSLFGTETSSGAPVPFLATLDPMAMFEGKSRSDAEGLAFQLGCVAKAFSLEQWPSNGEDGSEILMIHQ